MKLRYGGGTRGLHGIGNRDNAHHASAHRQEQRGFAFVGQAFGFVLEFAQVHAMLLHELGISHYAHRSVVHARNASAGNLAEIARLGDAKGHAFRTRNNRAAKRMLRFFLEGRRDAEQLIRFHARGAQHVGNFRRAFSDSARFVKHYGFHIMGSLERFGRFRQNAGTRATARAHHNGARRCQAKRARAANHEHRNRMGK